MSSRLVRAGRAVSRVTARVSVAALLIGVWSTRAHGQCTMTGGPVQFAPGGGGGIAAKPLKFGNGGYANSLDLYTSGSTKRLIVMENYGYGVYDASNPAAPVVIGY